MQVTKLKYENTNTYFVRGTSGSLLVDTDYAGILPAFYKAIKKENISLSDLAMFWQHITTQTTLDLSVN